MQRKDVAVLALLLLSVSSPGRAQTGEDLRAWDQMRARELERLPGVVRAYANSIGCEVAFTPKNVVRWEGAPGVQYVALVALDVGCSGGSRSRRSVLMGVREGAWGKLFVDATYSLPELTSMQFPQLIDSLYNTKDGVRFVGRIPQGDDPDNRPSRRVSGTVVWSGREWTVLGGECGIEQC